MLELFLSFLIDFGLIREDYKHRKRISKKEVEDGVSRYFQKPSSIITLFVIVITTLILLLFFFPEQSTSLTIRTKQEITEISKRTEKWKNQFGKYPLELNELIGNYPLRKTWKTDSWNNPYRYSVTQDGASFVIISAGSDGIFNTKDDIKSE